MLIMSELRLKTPESRDIVDVQTPDIITSSSSTCIDSVNFLQLAWEVLAHMKPILLQMLTKMAITTGQSLRQSRSPQVFLVMLFMVNIRDAAP